MVQKYVIGVDVGGTNTDSCLFEVYEKKVIASNKTQTTSDVSTGIIKSIESLFSLQNVVKKSDIISIMIGTTHFVNAVIQNSSDLCPVSVVRICGPSTRICSPFFDWEPKLRSKISIPSQIKFLDGGFEFNGNEISKFNEKQIIETSKSLIEDFKKRNKEKKQYLLNIVISSIFGPVKTKHEDECEKIMEKEFLKAKIPFKITKSYNIANLGLLERENAAILNSSLKPLASKTIDSFINAIHLLKLEHTSLFLTQNDGTLISMEKSKNFPVYTFASGPTNSMRGASFITGLKDGIVVDIGGTTSDVGVLEKGLPRLSQSHVEINGVRTNFRMPDTVSIGLGGGSIVDLKNNQIGPKSVGFNLKKDSQSFGGKILTATDISLLSNKSLKIEGTDINKIEKIDDKKIEKMKNLIISKIETIIDCVKTSPIDQPVIICGGGSILLDGVDKIKGASKLIVPEHFGVVNAIGAAISQVSYTIDQVISFSNSDRKKELEKLKEKAILKCEENGGLKKSIEIIEIEEIQLGYIPGNVYRVKIKAIGDLDYSKISQISKFGKEDIQMKNILENTKIANQFIEKTCLNKIKNHEKMTNQEILNYKPTFRYNEKDKRKEWILTKHDIEMIAIGTSILGTGGGGSVYTSNEICKNLLDQGKEIRVISPDSIMEDENTIGIGFMGAPMILTEKPPSGIEVTNALKRMIKINQNDSKKKDSKNCLFSIEIGGANGMTQLWCAAMSNIPVIDADGMGRAYPQLNHFYPFISGVNPTPLLLVDEKGNEICLTNVQNNDISVVETYMRLVVVQMGCTGALVLPPLSKKQIKENCVTYTLSKSWLIGREVTKAKILKKDKVESVCKEFNGIKIMEGKIVDVSRKTEGGFNKGVCTIVGINDYEGKKMKIDFQNENLVAKNIIEKDGKENENIIASVPDLIVMLDRETGDGIQTENLKYGLRVEVIVLPSTEQYKKKIALDYIHPKKFGYDIEFKSIGESKIKHIWN